jgi:hypothetical protein
MIPSTLCFSCETILRTIFVPRMVMLLKNLRKSELSIETELVSTLIFSPSELALKVAHFRREMLELKTGSQRGLSQAELTSLLAAPSGVCSAYAGRMRSLAISFLSHILESSLPTVCPRLKSGKGESCSERQLVTGRTAAPALANSNRSQESAWWFFG